jgi:hypothetical protein
MRKRASDGGWHDSLDAVVAAPAHHAVLLDNESSCAAAPAHTVVASAS